MKNFKFLAVITTVVLALASADAFSQNKNEEDIATLKGETSSITERLNTMESDLAKLTRIKISGYVQAQYQYFQSPLVQPDNYFSLRRARFKMTYEPVDGVKFVLQPDFAPGSLSIKDAYVVLNDRWTKQFSLTAGKFNKLNYEVEYSSSQRELPERSLVIRTLYPSERAIGAKLEYKSEKLPLHLQLALINGNEYMTIRDAAGNNLNSSNGNKDFDNFKDVMARATYKFKLGQSVGLDLGAHGYWGKLKANSAYTLNGDYTTFSEGKIGDGLSRSWYGAEFQLFADFLGGMSLKGEYLAGKNATTGYGVTAASGTTAAKPGMVNMTTDFTGYYLYLIKNLGKKNQFAMRLDYFDPNRDITGKEVKTIGFTSTKPTEFSNVTSGKTDLATTTLGFAFHHYFDSNIRITLAYEIPMNERTASEGLLTEDYTKADGTKVVKGIDYYNHVPQDLFTLRIQCKF